jgi:hypothetical protein
MDESTEALANKSMDFNKEFSGYPYVFRFRGPSKRTLSELEEGYFYFANRNQLNDPFDANSSFIKLTNDNNSLQEFYNILVSSFPDNSSRNEFLRNYDLDSYKSLLSEQMGFFLNHFGVVCFSTHIKNYLMWSNYSKNGQGLCLQFNVEKDKSIFKNLRVMDYVEEPKIFTFNPNSHHDTLDKLFFQKTLEWSKEKEIRLIQPHVGKWSFDKKCLDKVILGYNSKEYFVKKVKTIVRKNYPHANLFKMNEPKEYNKVSLTLL